MPRFQANVCILGTKLIVPDCAQRPICHQWDPSESMQPYILITITTMVMSWLNKSTKTSTVPVQNWKFPHVCSSYIWCKSMIHGQYYCMYSVTTVFKGIVCICGKKNKYWTITFNLAQLLSIKIKGLLNICVPVGFLMRMNLIIDAIM